MYYEQDIFSLLCFFSLKKNLQDTIKCYQTEWHDCFFLEHIKFLVITLLVPLAELRVRMVCGGRMCVSGEVLSLRARSGCLQMVVDGQHCLTLILS